MINLREIQIKQIYKEYFTRSFYGFVKTLWSEVEPNKYVDNWHIEKVCDMLEDRFNAFVYESENINNKVAKERTKDLLFNLPPGSTKSMIISVFFPAWVWFRRPSTRIICTSYSYAIAEELASKCLKLMQSDTYMNVSSFKITKTALVNMKNSIGGQRFTTSTGGTITGLHADIIINDDPNSPQSIYSPVAREEAKRFISEVLPSRKINIRTGYTITVQQRLHNDDVSGNLLEAGNLIHLSVPAIDADGKSFFENRFPVEFLLLQKERLGTISYNAQYLQRTQEASGGIIKRDWLIEDITQPPKGLIYFIDSAYGGKNADYNAVLGCYKIGNKLFLHTLEINKLEFPELIKRLGEIIEPNSKVYIEGKASGKSIIQTLKAESSFNVIEKKVVGDKTVRKHAMSPFFESGRIIINKNIKHKVELIEQLIFDETRYDDILDVVMHATEQLLRASSGNYNVL
jgi:predicted phage terminase large subunit-like protein